jgi:uncharacterized small protein (DUF1192 family)
MSTLFLTDRVVQPVPSSAHQDHANIALGCVLDAEIEALKARLRRRFADGAVAGDRARADLDRQVGWLREDVAKLQARRDELS